MAANSDVMYAQSVNRLKLKSVSRYVAYALTEAVKGLKHVEDGRETIVHKPFDVVRNKIVTSSKISVVYPTDYMSLCTSEDPEEFVRNHRHSSNYIYRVLAQTLDSLIRTGIMKHLCFYKVVNKITDTRGSFSFIIGYDFGGYEDMAALGQDWFLFNQTNRTMNM